MMPVLRQPKPRLAAYKAAADDHDVLAGLLLAGEDVISEADVVLAAEVEPDGHSACGEDHDLSPRVYDLLLCGFLVQLDVDGLKLHLPLVPGKQRAIVPLEVWHIAELDLAAEAV